MASVYNDSFVAPVTLRARSDNFSGKRVHIFSKASLGGVGMMVQQGKQTLSSNVGIGEVEVMLPFGISAHFAHAEYKSKGINISMWKCPMTEEHADEMEQFAQNLIDVGSLTSATPNALKKKAEETRKPPCSRKKCKA